jgi:hypothetical protein
LEDITFGIDDDNAPHWPLIVPFSPSFTDFDPVRSPDQLAAPFYEQTFRPFLNGVDRMIEADDQEKDGRQEDSA